MRPEHLNLLSAAGTPSLTPDGCLAVVAVTRPDHNSDRYLGGLWVLPTDGGPARRLTNGESDSSPAVCPLGRRVAFLRAGADGPPQLYLTELDGGEPLRLTDQPLGAGAPVWSPDGTRLAWSARVAEPGRYGTPDAEDRTPKPAEEAPRLVTELRYRMDQVGYTRDRRRHLFALEVPASPERAGAELPALPLPPVQLTDGDQDDTDPAWSPDGRTLAFVSARHASRERDLRTAAHLVSADLTDGALRRVTAATTGDVSLGAVQWLSDGRLVVIANQVGASGRDFVGRPAQLWVTESPVASGETPATLRPLTDEETDLEGDSSDLVPTDAGVLVREVHRGAVRLVAVDPDASSALAVQVDAPLVVQGHAATPDGRTVVVVAGAADRAGDVAVLRDGELTWLTDLSARLREEAGIVPVQELVAPTPDGHEVHGWLLLPDASTYGEGPHPVVLVIHGGPHAAYDGALFDEAQVYAGAGYAVVMCNPRGSAGYGLEHGRCVRGALGTVDAEDVQTFLDHALEEHSGSLDAERVGVMGGSYGGFMTALLTTRTDRFAGAIVERGFLDGTSFVGSADIGWFFPGEYSGDAAAIAEQSPMTYVDRVTTPTLVIHSEEDWRCPVEQGQRWFTALRMRDVPTELLLFPGEGHELSRSGRPRHRRQRFEHILRWWARHLPVGETRSSARFGEAPASVGG